MRILIIIASLLFTSAAYGQTIMHYVAKTGDDTSNNCQTQGSPCLTPEYAVTQTSGGDTLEIGDGTYILSEPVNPPNGIVSGDTLRSTIRAVSGAKVIFSALNTTIGGTWSSEGNNIWSIAWDAAWTTPVHIDNQNRIDIGEREAYRENIVVEGDSLPYGYYNSDGFVGMPAGFIWIEDNNADHSSPSTLYIHLRNSGDPNSTSVHLSNIAGVFNINPSNCNLSNNDLIHIDGIYAQYGASCYGSGIVNLGRAIAGGNIFENGRASYGNSYGIKGGGSDNMIRNNTISYNGQGNVRFTNGRFDSIYDNFLTAGNTKGYRCENMCGNKHGTTWDLTFKGNIVDSEGYEEDGVWFDVDSKRPVIYNNIFHDNQRSCIFLEFGSSKGLVYNNVCHDLTGHDGNFAPLAIYVKESSGHLIAHNTIINGHGGIRMRSGTPRAGTGLFSADQQGELQHTVGNLFINNAIINSNWVNSSGEDFQVWWNNHSDFTTAEQFKSNKADGNLYTTADSTDRFFRWQPTGGNTNYYLNTSQTNNFAQWKIETGYDAGSFKADIDGPLVVNQSDHLTGWEPSVNSQLVGQSVAIPDTSWWSPLDVSLDFYGVTRSVTGGAIIGASEATSIFSELEFGNVTGTYTIVNDDIISADAIGTGAVYGSSIGSYFVQLATQVDNANVSVEAQIYSQTGVSSIYSGGGPAILSTDDATSVGAMITTAAVFESTQRAYIQSRYNNGSGWRVGATTVVTLPYYARVTMTGTTISFQLSENGTTWSSFGPNATISGMSGSSRAGVMMTSNSAVTTTDMEFRDVSIVQGSE